MEEKTVAMRTLDPKSQLFKVLTEPQKKTYRDVVADLKEVPIYKWYCNVEWPANRRRHSNHQRQHRDRRVQRQHRRND
jgi:hypothetical protein